MLESPTMTCSRRKRSASACGSSRVLMIGRDRVVADDTLSQMCSARWDRQYTAPRGVCSTLPAPQTSWRVTRNGSSTSAIRENSPARAPRVFLVPALGVACGVGVFLEQEDAPADALVAEPPLGVHQQIFEDPLSSLVVRHQLGQVVTLGGGAL